MFKAIAMLRVVCSCVVILMMAGALAHAYQDTLGTADHVAQHDSCGSDAPDGGHLCCHSHCGVILTALLTIGKKPPESVERFLILPQSIPSGPVEEIEHPPQLG